jgi:hypothetical protein
VSLVGHHLPRRSVVAVRKDWVEHPAGPDLGPERC